MSDYYPACIRAPDRRRIWQVRRKPRPFVGAGPTVVWSGITKAACRGALRELREVEEWYSSNAPKGKDEG